MSFVSIGKALQLIGGTPIKTAKKVIAENLRVARNTSMPPELSGLLSQVLQGGPAAAGLSNPMALAQGQMSGVLQGALGQLQGVSGQPFGALTSALQGNLTGALGNLSQATNLLSGLASPGTGQFGLLDMVSHAANLPSGAPAHMALDLVTRPLQMQAALGAMTSQVEGLVGGVIAGTMPESAAVQSVDAMAAAINGAVQASNGAMSALQGATEAMAGVQAAAEIVAGPPGPIRDVVDTIVGDAQRTQIKQAFEAMRA